MGRGGGEGGGGLDLSFYTIYYIQLSQGTIPAMELMTQEKQKPGGPDAVRIPQRHRVSSI